MGTIFHKIINREVPSYVIAEDEENMAILDIFPDHYGQILIIPKQHTTSKFSAANPGLLSSTALFAQKVAAQIERQMPNVARCVVSIEGFEVDYLHIKLYPIINQPQRSEQPKQANEEELKGLQEMLKFEV